MKRKVLSSLLAVLLTVSLFPAAQTAQAVDLEEKAQLLAVLDIMTGNELGDLMLDQPVTRAAFTRMLVSASPVGDSVRSASSVSPYPDVPASHWAAPFVEAAVKAGYVSGYLDGTFRPDEDITLVMGVTMAVRLLGYPPSDFDSAVWGEGQMALYHELGLDKDISLTRDQVMTRRDALCLFYDLLTAKTKSGAVYAVTLGYPVVNDKVDFLTQAKKDLSGPYVAGQAAPVLPFGPAVTYLNDREVSSHSWAADDVYYYNADLRILWVYRDTVFGQLNALAPTAASPTAVTVGGRSYPLATDEAKDKLAALGEEAAGSLVTLLLGMDGQVVYAHTVNGPFVATDQGSALPFEPQQTYRNGKAADAAVPGLYDVYYYDADAKTVWIYTQRVSGKITALSPTVLAPTSISVDGVPYALPTALTRRFSALSGDWSGRYVTLLFGMDGGVVEILTGDTVETDYYGVVQSSQKASQDGVVRTDVTVLCTDGRLRTFTGETDASYPAGKLVRAHLSSDSVKLSPLPTQSITGLVNGAASMVGEIPFADHVQILDVRQAQAIPVEPSRLAGVRLDSKSVKFCAKNAAGEISVLILNDLTGDMDSYGVMTSAVQVEIPSLAGLPTLRGTYVYDLGGTSYTYVTQNSLLNLTEGPILVEGSPYSPTKLRKLTQLKLSHAGSATATEEGGSAWPVWEGVSVYEQIGGRYLLTTLDHVRTDYRLTGYYDKAISAGGCIRVILATPDAS